MTSTESVELSSMLPSDPNPKLANSKSSEALASLESAAADKGKAFYQAISTLSKNANHVPTEMTWENVNFSVGKKQILSNVWGKVKPGELCCIMGPSGSGKSSLLNVLAGRSAPAPGISITGNVKVNGTSIDPVAFRRSIAYVMQDDALMATATPREALQFSASLRLPAGTPASTINDLVTYTLDDLGLNECADVLIGGPLIKGISGGQRKRTSVGVEIISDPSLLFLDEPTSGLDSYSAYNCIQLLKNIAKRDAGILVTIHQPSSEVFFLFDTCIFLKDGRVLYQGPVDTISKHFSSLGFHCPEHYNPSDYIMFTCETNTSEQLEASGLFMTSQSMQLVGAEEGKASKSSISDPSTTITDVGTVSKAPLFSQIYWLSLREFRNISRDVGALIGRFGITIFLNLLFGLIFLKSGSKDDSNPSNFQTHFGAITFAMISSMFGAAQPVMLMFPFERPMFMREYSTGTYSAITYFLSKVVIELPLTFTQSLLQWILLYWMMDLNGSFIFFVLESWILGLASSSVALGLGAAVSNVKDVTELAPLLFVPQLLFAGFFIRTSQIPVFLRWAQYLCGIKYTMNLTLLTEFNAKNPNCQGTIQSALCKAAIDDNDIVPDKYWVYILILVALFCGFRILAALILVHKAKKFY